VALRALSSFRAPSTWMRPARLVLAYRSGTDPEPSGANGRPRAVQPPLNDHRPQEGLDVIHPAMLHHIKSCHGPHRTCDSALPRGSVHSHSRGLNRELSSSTPTATTRSRRQVRWSHGSGQRSSTSPGGHLRRHRDRVVYRRRGEHDPHRRRLRGVIRSLSAHRREALPAELEDRQAPLLRHSDSRRACRSPRAIRP
jgi:hypothetical protein